jgi:hypothetical protein
MAVPVRAFPCILLLSLLLAAPPARAAESSPRQRRAMLDLMKKKPDSTPPVKPRSNAPVKGRGLERAVGTTVANHRPAFQACIEKASKRNARRKTSARATLKLTVRPDGAVAGARVAERRIRDRPLGVCLVQASMRMTFPPFEGAPVEINVPLELTAQ